MQLTTRLHEVFKALRKAVQERKEAHPLAPGLTEVSLLLTTDGVEISFGKDAPRAEVSDFPDELVQVFAKAEELRSQVPQSALPFRIDATSHSYWFLSTDPKNSPEEVGFSVAGWKFSPNYDLWEMDADRLETRLEVVVKIFHL